MRTILVIAGVLAVAACQRGQEPAVVNIVSYDCGGLRVDAVFQGEDTVELDVAGKPLTLPIAASASGSRYADGRGNEFWTKGLKDGLLTVAGEARRSCTAPADKAAAAGSADGRSGFMAIGQEPGWRVDVDPGAAPRLRASLDYGNRRIEVARAAPTDSGWSGAAADGTPVRLVIVRTSCQDSMSGEPFEVEATLTVADQVYRGCGRFLAD
jgi:uncharacterized membrane protein